MLSYRRIHISDINSHIGKKIKDLRSAAGMSQGGLAEKLNVTANTVSRWESATYEPKLEDLERIARLFDKPIWVFFPSESQPAKKELQALLSKAGDLPAQDVQELIRYSDFIRARSAHRGRRKMSREVSGRGEK
jgi:transcriptional regulator with XRE-family HTH domain